MANPVDIILPGHGVSVFISSRLGEFAKERKALVKMIRDGLALTPVVFEDVSRPFGPRDLYTAYLKQCQIFIGIYGTGYGAAIPKAGLPDISGLHEEWNLSTGKDRLVFLKKTKNLRDAKLQKLIDEIADAGVSYTYFNSLNDLLEKARKAISLVLQQAYIHPETLATTKTKPPLVASKLLPELRFAISTNSLTEVTQALKSFQRVELYGPMGSGKTFVLSQIHSKTKSIYLSLRGTSLLGAFAQAANSLSELSGSISAKRDDPDPISAVQRLFFETDALVMIDDAEQSPETAEKFLSLDCGTARLLLACRSATPKFLPPKQTIMCGGFDNNEAKSYLTLAAPKVASELALDAIDKSHGNPLYLRYFVHEPSISPPTSLNAFHQRIWEAMPQDVQAAVGLVSLSEYSFNVEQLGRALTSYTKKVVTGIGANKLCNQTSILITNSSGRLDTFHPAISEWIRKYLTSAGLAKKLHRAIADSAEDKSNRYIKVFHLASAGERESILSELPDAISWALATQKMTLCRPMLAAMLQISRAKSDFSSYSFATYQAAQVSNARGRLRSAIRMCEIAERLAAKGKMPSVRDLAEAFRATMLVEIGRGVEAIPILTRVATDFKGVGNKQFEGMSRVNLGYALMKLGRFVEAETELKAAYRLFVKVKDAHGIGTALVNLAAIVTPRSDKASQMKYVKELVRVAKAVESPRFEAAAQNSLTIMYRRSKKFDKARIACNRAIFLARQMGNIELEAMNASNLGNVERDVGNHVLAKQLYEKSLLLAKRSGSRSAIAGASHSIALSLAEEGKVEEAYSMSSFALGEFEYLHDDYQVARICGDLAEFSVKLGRTLEAARYHRRAANAYARTGLLSLAVGEAGGAQDIYVASGLFEDAAKVLDELWDSAVVGKSQSAEFIDAIIKRAMALDPRVQKFLPTDKWIDVLMKTEYSLLGDELRETVRRLSVLHKRSEVTGESVAMFRLLHSLAEKASTFKGDASASIMFSLAAGIEQLSTEDILCDEFAKLCRAISEQCSELHYESKTSQIDRWLLLLPARNAPAIEILCNATNASTRLVGAFTSLSLWTSRHLVTAGFGRRKWKSLGLSLAIEDAEQWKSLGLEVPSREGQYGGLILRASTAAGENALSVLYIADDYLAMADWEKHPKNTLPALPLLEVYDAMSRAFFGDKATNALRPQRQRFVAYATGLVFGKNAKS